MILYHATLAGNIETISKNGLTPQEIKHISDFNCEPVVILFNTHEDCINSLFNWLGNELVSESSDSEIVTIKVNIPNDVILEDYKGIFKISRSTIPPDYISFNSLEN